ncbi:MAG: GAP family protein [Actinobacteria bacterium]|nr:GAP family protein [Actinomycetota bacterium]
MDYTVVDVIGHALPLAVGVALSPFPLISVVLLLMSPRGRAAGATFLVGRVLGLAVMLAIIIAASELLYSAANGTGIPTVIKLLIGVALIVLGLSKWRPKPAGTEPKLPGWMNAIDGFSPARAFGLGLLLSITNPKELALAIPLGVTIGGALLAPGETVLVGALFVLVASISVAVPVIALAIAPTRMRPALDRLRAWLTQNHSVVMGVLLIVIGAVVAGGAISDF